MNRIAPPSHHRGKQTVLLAGLAIAALWLLSPALTSVHVEGYSAQLIGIADAFDGDGVAKYDPLMQLPTEFLYLTRFGTIMLLACIHHAFGPVGDFGFKCLTLVSFAVLIAASTKFSRAWGGVPAWASCAALLLLPGLPQIAFYFNDNVVSAACLAAGFAILVPASAWPRYFAAGIFAGCGILCRTDAIIALPLVFALGLIGAAPRTIAVRTACILTGILLALAGAYLFGDYDLIAAFRVGAVFATQHPFTISHRLLVAALFFNLTGTVAIICGGAMNLQQHLAMQDIRWTLALVVLPALLIVAACYEATNLRYGYPLFTPVFALHGGKAVMSLPRLWRTRGRPIVAARLCTSLLISLAPPYIVMNWDGFQSLLGRVWEPIGWRVWQRRNRDSATQIAAWLGGIHDNDRAVVITTHYNDDFFLRQHVLDAGYQIHRAQDVLPACHGFFIYTKGSRAIAHIRTDTLYELAGKHVGAALQLAQAAQCPALDGYGKAYISSYAADPAFLTPALYGAVARRFSDAEGVVFLAVTPAEFEDVLGRATHLAAALRTPDGSPMTYRIFSDFYASRFLHCNPRWPGHGGTT